MQRVNPFNMIHKALRALLYDTALSLQQTYFADSNESEVALAKIEAVIHQFEQHAYHEDTYVFPAVEAYNPQLAEAFESEHEEDHAHGACVTHLRAREGRLVDVLDDHRGREPGSASGHDED